MHSFSHPFLHLIIHPVLPFFIQQLHLTAEMFVRSSFIYSFLYFLEVEKTITNAKAYKPLSVEYSDK